MLGRFADDFGGCISGKKFQKGQFGDQQLALNDESGNGLVAVPSVDGLCPISGQFTDLGSRHQVFVIGCSGFPCCKQAGFLLFCKMKYSE